MNRSGVSRRSFVKEVLVGAATLTVPGVGTGRAEPPEDNAPGDEAAESQGTEEESAERVPTLTRPANLLVIMADQQSCWTLGAYGSINGERQNVIGTPHIDGLARDGAKITQYFTNSPLCTPSRGCAMTGRYPFSHGAYDNDVPLNSGEITLAHCLAALDYQTGYAGKWHLAGTASPGWAPAAKMGFTDNRFMFNRGHWKKIVSRSSGPPKTFPYSEIGTGPTYTTNWITDRAIEFVTAHKDDPFFYMVSFPDPHPPYTVQSSYADDYREGSMLIPSTFKPDPVNGVRSAAELRSLKAQYCGEVKCIDDNVGRLLSALERLGLTNNTMVVFIADHGDYMGEHGRLGKDHYYEAAIRIPCLIKFPGKVRAGHVVNELVSSVDLMPTLLGLLGAPKSGREQGRDASRLLLGASTAWNNQVFIHDPHNDYAAVFTPEVELVLQRRGGHVLFDRLRDPLQQANLYSDARFVTTIRTLGQAIVAQHAAQATPAYAWLKDITFPS